jgi:hypothetical protein
MGKKKATLPNRLLALPNADKAFHEKWTTGRNLLNFPHPFRGVFLGPPNTGKSTTVKNIILRAKPAFEEVICIHCDSEYTQEWEDVGATMMSEIPAPEDWEGEVKTLVVLDDLEYKGMSKDQKRNLDRLFGYCSTHKNISVCLCSQDPFNVPPIVRRCSNLWVIWSCSDIDAMSTCARKTGIKPAEFHRIFSRLLTEPRDSLWLDMSSKSPAPMRKNGYTLIKKEE